MNPEEVSAPGATSGRLGPGHQLLTIMTQSRVMMPGQLCAHATGACMLQFRELGRVRNGDGTP